MAERDGGSATVWMLVAISAAVAVAVVASGVLGVYHAGARADTAADLAALAAADTALGGVELSCARAAQVAERNGARLRSCRLDGGSSHVSVTVELPGWLHRYGEARASARAGPTAERRWLA